MPTDSTTIETNTRTWEPDAGPDAPNAVLCGMNHCPHAVYESAATPVDVGGTEIPVCPFCTKNELGVDVHETGFGDTVTPWITGKTVTAFVIGFALSLVLFSMFVV